MTTEHDTTSEEPRLNSTEIRILGCLIEKQATSPETYPLTLNALVIACNQKTSREPVMNLSQGQVGQSLRALEGRGFTRLVMAGGVSANRTLRGKLAEMMQKRGGEVFYARPEFCTDNGAMIAYAGLVRLKSGGISPTLGVSVRPRWPLAELPAV